MQNWFWRLMDTLRGEQQPRPDYYITARAKKGRVVKPPKAREQNTPQPTEAFNVYPPRGARQKNRDTVPALAFMSGTSQTKSVTFNQMASSLLFKWGGVQGFSEMAALIDPSEQRVVLTPIVKATGLHFRLGHDTFIEGHPATYRLGKTFYERMVPAVCDAGGVYELVVINDRLLAFNYKKTLRVNGQ